MIGAEINAGDFLKSILNVVDFIRTFKCNHYFKNSGVYRPVPTNWNVWPEMKLFYIDFSYCKERQSLVIPFIADIRN